MTQNTQSTNITAEQNNLVEVDQGGTLRYGISRIYWNYDFEPLSGLLYNPEVAKIYAEIGKEFAEKVSENRVVRIASQVMKTYPEKKNFWGKWFPPEYVENPYQQEIKNNLKKGKYGDCLWADYEWCVEFLYRLPITNMMTSTRDYARQIHVLKEQIDLSLIDEMMNISDEAATVGIRIYPHSKLERLETDKETLRKYIHRDDFIVQIAFDDKWTGVTIQPNPKYMTYNQLIEIIEPIFEKHGLKLKDKANPYPKYGFPLEDEFKQHREYPCAGYRFFD